MPTFSVYMDALSDGIPEMGEVAGRTSQAARGGTRGGSSKRGSPSVPRVRRSAKRTWGITSIGVCVAMASIWLVAVPLVFAPPAQATSGSVLILSTSVNGGTSSPEANAATADGYSVTVDSATTWASLTEANFASYSAIVIGDPSGGSCSSTVPSAALSSATLWGQAVTGTTTSGGGNVAVIGTAPSYAGASGTALMEDAIAYAASGSVTGLYVSLNCDYSSASANTAVPLLAYVDGGGFTVKGQSSTCQNTGTVNTLLAAENSEFASLQSSALGTWASPACSVEETFDTWPSGLSGLGYDTAATPADFTASDGLTGQPYVLVGAAASSGTLDLAPSSGGEVPAGASYGSSNPASPGVSQNRGLVANPIDPETGDFSESGTDLSIPTYGPALDFSRTYDAQLAAQQTKIGVPGPLGYGWTDNWATSLSLGNSAPGDIYTLDGLGTNIGDGGPAGSAELTWPSGIQPSGSTEYIADTGGNQIRMVAGSTSSAFLPGQSLTVGDIYTIAGFVNGTPGHSGDGGLATAAYLKHPTDVALDSSGNLYIADWANNRIQEIPVSSGTYWGISMTADHIYTIAGNGGGTGGVAGDGGAATSSYLNGPSSMTFDSSGNLYIADSVNNRVQRVCAVSACGTVDDIYTFAGNAAGTGGYTGDGGSPTSAYLSNPTYLRFSGNGSLYIADEENNRIQDVSGGTGTLWGVSMTKGDVYTVAGRANGTAGHSGDGGAATSAYLDLPVSLALDNGGQLYVVDSGNNRVQEVAYSSHTEWGVSMTADDVYTIAGSASGTSGFSGDGGAATSALMDDPNGVTLDASLNLYVADSGNNRVREVNVSTADISTYAGNGNTIVDNGDGGPSDIAWLSSPTDAVSDAEGNIYIADCLDNRIQEIAASNHTQWGISMTKGDVYTVAGYADGAYGSSGDGNLGTDAYLDCPEGVAVDSSGNLYIADSGNNRIQEVPASSGTQWGTISMTAAHMYTISGSSTGTPGTAQTGVVATSALYDLPVGMAVDAAGDVYIVDYYNNQVREIARASGTQWGSISMTANYIYTVAGSVSGTTGDSGDGGRATSALLAVPAGITLDSAGNLYIADAGNNRIQEVAAATTVHWGQSMTAGDIYTIAGSASGTSGLTGDYGPASSSLLNTPGGVAVDSSGNLYIADTLNNRIQEVAGQNGVQWSSAMGAGDIYTVAGSSTGATGYSADGGPATSALLAGPFSIAVDPSGALYLTDTNNNRLREVVATAASPFSLSPPPAAFQVTVSEETGADITFYPKVSGSCTAAPYLVVAGGYCALPEDVGASLTYNSGSNTYSFSASPGETDTYNGTGQLTAESDADGDTLTLSYSSPSPGSGECPSTASSCNTVTSAGGRALVIGLNSAGLVTSVTDPLGRRWTYAYNSGDDLTSVTDPMSRVTSFTYGNGTTGNPLLVNDMLTVTKPNAQSGGPDAGDDTAIVYSALGQVTSETDPMDRVTTYNYTGFNASTGNGIVSLGDPDGYTTVYDYQSGALVAQSVWTGAIGSTLVSENDDVPNLTASGTTGGSLLTESSTNGDLNSSGALEDTSFTYDSSGNETSEVDPLGEKMTNWSTSLDESSCDGTATASSNCSSSLEGPAPVTPGGTITPPSSAPPEGVTYTEYDTYGNALYTTTGVYNPPSAPSASYSQSTFTLYEGNTVTLSGPGTVSCTATPPSHSLPCATINADQVVTQLAYDSEGDLTSSSTLDGNPGSQMAETTYSYDGDGEQTASVAPDGNLSGATDPVIDNYTTATAYDSDGEVTSTTEAGGTLGTGPTVTPRTTYDYYDGNGNKTSVKDPRGYTTSYGFNADDEQTLLTDPDGNETLTCYDGDGHVAETVPPVGVAANSLTAASCPTSYPSGYGDRLASDATTYTYDVNGNKTAMTTPAPAGQSGDETTSYTYDQAGNLIETIAPPTSNSGGAPNDDTYNTYNADGELATVTTGYGTSAASTTSYCYDPNGDTTSVVAPDGNASGVAACETSSPWVVSASTYPTQAAYQTTSSYDSAGELVSTTMPATSAAPSGITTSYTYDDQGNKLSSTDEIGVATDFTYTPTNMVSMITYSGSSAPTVNYTYDADGSKTAMTDASGSSSYVYDPFGELTSADNGASQTVGYGYNADGEVTGITYPLGSGATWATTDTVAYGYDNAGELNSVTDFNNKTISISNTADGLPYSETLGSSGDSIATTYDPTDSPSAIDLKNGSTTLLGFSYSDAPSGAILAETDTPTSSQSPADYTYSAQSRVTSMTPGSGSALNYGFDASGNLTTIPTGATGTYDDSGELTSSVLSSTTTSYTYNADGEQLSAKQGSTTITSGTWNGAGEVTSYSDPSADMSTATYDGDDLRSSETSTPTGGSAITQDFVWNTTSPVPNLLMDSTNAYIFAGAGTPAEQVNLSTGAIDYLFANSLGSVRGVATSSGSLSASVDYDAWGNPETLGGLSSYTPFGFAGAYTDPSGALYLIDRYYDPATGQFLSVDPKVAQSQQAYVYTSDDPVNETDPTGMLGGGPGEFCSGEPGGCHFGHESVFGPVDFIVRIAKATWAHRRQIVNAAGLAGGLLASVACTLATDGLCAVAIAELPVGEVALSALFGATSSAATYALSGNKKSLEGFVTAAAGGSGIGTIIGLPSTVTGLFIKAGEHAAPVKFLPALRDLFESLGHVASKE